MDSVKEIMGKYFKEDKLDKRDFISGRSLLTESVPVVPCRETWEVVDSPERLMRRFVFSDRSRLRDFVLEVLNYEDEVGPHGSLRVSGLEVDVEVYTHDLNRITNRDREYAAMVDAIHGDVSHYAY